MTGHVNKHVKSSSTLATPFKRLISREAKVQGYHDRLSVTAVFQRNVNTEDEDLFSSNSFLIKADDSIKSDARARSGVRTE